MLIACFCSSNLLVPSEWLEQCFIPKQEAGDVTWNAEVSANVTTISTKIYRREPGQSEKFWNNPRGYTKKDRIFCILLVECSLEEAGFISTCFYIYVSVSFNLNWIYTSQTMMVTLWNRIIFFLISVLLHQPIFHQTAVQVSCFFPKCICI